VLSSSICVETTEVARDAFKAGRLLESLDTSWEHFRTPNSSQFSDLVNVGNHVLKAMPNESPRNVSTHPAPPNMQNYMPDFCGAKTAGMRGLRARRPGGGRSIERTQTLLYVKKQSANRRNLNFEGCGLECLRYTTVQD